MWERVLMHLFSKKLSTGSKQYDNLESGNVCQIIEIGSVSGKKNKTMSTSAQ